MNPVAGRRRRMPAERRPARETRSRRREKAIAANVQRTSPEADLAIHD